MFDMFVLLCLELYAHPIFCEGLRPSENFRRPRCYWKTLHFLSTEPPPLKKPPLSEQELVLLSHTTAVNDSLILIMRASPFLSNATAFKVNLSLCAPRGFPCGRIQKYPVVVCGSAGQVVEVCLNERCCW